MSDHGLPDIQPETASSPTSAGTRSAIGGSYRFYRGKSITLELPSSISMILSELMTQTDHDAEEIFIKSLLLYKAAVDAVDAGKQIAILDSDGEIDQEITGL